MLDAHPAVAFTTNPAEMGPPGVPGVSPDDGVVANDAGRWVEESPEHGEKLAHSHVHCGHQFGDLGGPDHAAVHPEQTVEDGPRLQAEDGGLGMAQVEPPGLVEHEVEIQLSREAFIQFEAFAKEGDGLGGEVVRPQDGCGPGAAAAADVAAVQHRYVGHSQPAQVIGGGQSVNARADDDHFVPVFRLVPGEEVAGAERLQHAHPAATSAANASVPIKSMPYPSPASTSDSQT